MWLIYQWKSSALFSFSNLASCSAARRLAWIASAVARLLASNSSWIADESFDLTELLELMRRTTGIKPLSEVGTGVVVVVFVHHWGNPHHWDWDYFSIVLVV